MQVSITKKDSTLEVMATIAAILLCIGIFLKSSMFFYGAVACLIAGLFVKPLARPFSSLWIKLGVLLGDINSRIILGLVFLLLVVPLSLLRRAFSGNAWRESYLGIKCDSKKSYWIERSHTFSKSDFQRMW